MTVTDVPRPSARRLRRSTDDRLAAGVCGGLGEHLGLDPVLFRVLFATAAFFGVGLVAYAIAWVAIPGEGSDRSGLDSFGAELRRRRIPLWVAAWGLGLLVWLGFVGGRHAGLVTLLVIALAVVVLQRRPVRIRPTAVGGSELRTWVGEAVESARVRHRRRRPVYLLTLAAMVAAAGVVAVVDETSRVPLTAYSWTVGAVLITGLLVGQALRRTPVFLSVLLIPVVASLVAFDGTTVSLRDGVGDREWHPAAASTDASYRLAFGRTLLAVPADAVAGQHLRIDQAAGEVHVDVPATVDAIVRVHVNGGDVRLDDTDLHGGGFWDRTVVLGRRSPAAVVIDVHLGAGDVNLEHSTAPTVIDR